MLVSEEPEVAAVVWFCNERQQVVTTAEDQEVVRTLAEAFGAIAVAHDRPTGYQFFLLPVPLDPIQ